MYIASSEETKQKVAEAFFRAQAASTEALGLQASIAQVSDQLRAGLIQNLNCYSFASIDSSMEAARRLDSSLNLPGHDNARIVSMGNEASQFALIVAQTQTLGRGRLRRSWHSESSGGLYVTYVYRPQESIAVQAMSGVSLAISLSVKRVLDRLGVQSLLKWPNDVLVASPIHLFRKKLAGILLETSTEGSRLGTLSVGIGVNLNQNNFPEEIPAASIYQCILKDVCYFDFLANLSASVIKTLCEYASLGFTAYREEWLEFSALKEGSTLEVSENLDGGKRKAYFDSLDNTGALKVRFQGGGPRVHTLHSGDVVAI